MIEREVSGGAECSLRRIERKVRIRRPLESGDRDKYAPPSVPPARDVSAGCPGSVPREQPARSRLDSARAVLEADREQLIGEDLCRVREVERGLISGDRDADRFGAEGAILRR